VGSVGRSAPTVSGSTAWAQTSEDNAVQRLSDVEFGKSSRTTTSARSGLTRNPKTLCWLDYADERNFYKVEKLTKDGQHVELRP
jgi:cytoskeletal protein RodZ